VTCPRIEVDLDKIRHNTQVCVARLKARGIRVTAVTKAVCGHPAIASAMVQGGAAGLADARLSHVRRLRRSGLTCPVTLIRTPMLSQVDDVVQVCETSYNTQSAVIAALAAAALRHDTVHGIILMVEMGDRREGILPADLGAMARRAGNMPGVALKGIGANFACLNGMPPTAAKMRTLSDLAEDVEGQGGLALQTVSGGNSASLPWAFGGHDTGRINDLRLGEAILLGVDPVTGTPIRGLFRDAFTLVAEVIETDAASGPSGRASADFSMAGRPLVRLTSHPARIILAVGHQDINPAELVMPPDASFLGATSDHLVIGTTDPTLCVGSEVTFQVTYGILMRAMAAPDIPVTLHGERCARRVSTLRYGVADKAAPPCERAEPC